MAKKKSVVKTTRTTTRREKLSKTLPTPKDKDNSKTNKK